MKKFFLIAALAISTMANAQKFAHFNMADIMPNMTEYTTGMANIEKIQAQYQEEYQRLIKEYQTKGEEFDKLRQDESTAQAILQSKYNDLQSMEQSIKDFSQACDQDLQSKYAEMQEQVQTKIMNAVTKIADQGGYVYVMDVTSCLPGASVAHVNTALSTDITAQLKAALGI